jgi:hypothetical protein
LLVIQVKKPYAVAVGFEAGRNNQGQYCVAIGDNSGRDNQREHILAFLEEIVGHFHHESLRRDLLSLVESVDIR